MESRDGQTSPAHTGSFGRAYSSMRLLIVGFRAVWGLGPP